MTNRYYVTWTIDVDANSPRQAAEIAREIQLDPSSIATVFTVDTEVRSPVIIDLAEPQID